MFRVFVGLAMAVLWTVVAHAQQPANSRLDDIIKRGTLRVGMTGDYQPFTYFDKATAKFRGFDVDMAEALGKAQLQENPCGLVRLIPAWISWSSQEIDRPSGAI